MISQTGQYALRAIVALAAKPNSSLTTSELAEITHVPAKYLSKVMQLLAKAGLVTSKPGKKGGFSLKASPDKLSILSVIEAIDTTAYEETYPMGLQSYGNPLYPLHQKLQQLNAMVRQECGKIFISELLKF